MTSADPQPAEPAPAHLIAIDWGTSSLRAALMDAQGGILDRIAAPDGIMFTRGRSFEAIFDGLFGPWRVRHPEAAILASGMIGSRQGWVEAPYCACPAGFGELAAALAWHELADGARIGFVPGLRTTEQGIPDVMRGEEIQVFGALRQLGREDGMFILPGTHSKWVRVESGRIVAFRTFMSGEMFGVLRRHSILGRLMPGGNEGEADAFVPEAFDAGCALAMEGGEGALLNLLFSVRTQGLFGRYQPEELPSYLSGLLIGEEIREALALFGAMPAQVHLVGRGDLATSYGRGLALRDIEGVALDAGLTFAGLLALADTAGLAR